MKKRILRIGLLLLALITIVVIILYANKDNFKSKYAPEVVQTGNISIRLDNDTSFITSLLIIRNKSMFNIEIDSMHYIISLFGKPYMHKEELLNIDLKKYDSDTISFTLALPYVQLLDDAREQRKLNDSASFEVTAIVAYSTVLGKEKMPIEIKSKIKIPHPPELEIVDVKYEKISLKSVHANANIRITNNNNIALSISRLHYSMHIMGQGHVKGEYDPTIHIAPNGVSNVDLPIDITFENAGKTLFDVLMNQDNYPYSLTITADIESPEPMLKSFHVDLTKNGLMELRK